MKASMYLTTIFLLMLTSSSLAQTESPDPEIEDQVLESFRDYAGQLDKAIRDNRDKLEKIERDRQTGPDQIRESAKDLAKDAAKSIASRVSGRREKAALEGLQATNSLNEMMQNYSNYIDAKFNSDPSAIKSDISNLQENLALVNQVISELEKLKAESEPSVSKFLGQLLQAARQEKARQEQVARDAARQENSDRGRAAREGGIGLGTDERPSSRPGPVEVDSGASDSKPDTGGSSADRMGLEGPEIGLP